MPRLLVLRYPLPARASTSAEMVAACLAQLCRGHRVVLAGDSAGGFLALEAFLRARAVAAMTPSSTTLVGLCLVCPWLDLTHSSDAHTANRGRDGLHRNLIDHGARVFLGGEDSLEARRAASPVSAPPATLAALPAGSCLAICGARDILRDDCALLVRRAAEARAPEGAVAVHVCDDGVWGIHCGCLLPTAR